MRERRAAEIVKTEKRESIILKMTTGVSVGVDPWADHVREARDFTITDDRFSVFTISYSTRSASIGSTFAARRAGSHRARNATAQIVTATPT
jgi:hypothetical protein